jgi:hypothetical protein
MEWKKMSMPFDIFRIDPAGVRWLESAQSLDQGKTRICELAVNLPGEYILFDQKTGNKLVIDPGQAYAAKAC